MYVTRRPAAHTVSYLLYFPQASMASSTLWCAATICEATCLVAFALAGPPQSLFIRSGPVTQKVPDLICFPLASMTPHTCCAAVNFTSMGAP